jgi:transposase-like protein
MSKQMFTQQQIEKLLANENVLRCSPKSVTYTKQFKTRAIHLYQQGLFPVEIFTQAGLDSNLIVKNQPKECLRRWKTIAKRNGLDGLSEVRGKNSKKGGESKTKDLTDADKIKRMEIEIAYLKAENDFLAKLRAKRRE